ncbi:acetyl-CoA acetyltransferase [Streptomyces sp. M2CJ-2]|uniref:acetyl-CoA acetyltransferase n=1 Tax=Streptomyces sp. M2CJ-2 TaxID=2803948 RepID=UPI001925C3D7|nr:acetyl-CoA acetyltransferase [Streptomyces sp. M2CJ-2]MBL3668105.1 acetyl-CoA acetyltransferase [Streptomyces sp. M2CJ-2]
MNLDPRTPVLVGTGQLNQRDDALEPVDLLAAAAREAERDSGGTSLLKSLDAVRLVRMLSWRYRDPGALLAERVGASPRDTAYTADGGNNPQALLSGAASDIAAGRADVVLIGGAETWRTRMRLRARGERPAWTVQDETVPAAPLLGGSGPLLGQGEKRIGLEPPSWVYPLFEQAHRIDAGRTVEEQLRVGARLWADFSRVAADNPHAWIRRAHTAEEILTPSPDNRWIAWPYPKLMNSNNMVEQGAALLLCSVETARRHGVPSDRWIFPQSGAEANDTLELGARGELHRSPAIRISGRRALELAGTDAGSVDLVDVYSCFPSAVQIAARELGLALDDASRPLTVTGGLTFAGGPWNNYVSHSIATMAARLRDAPGAVGLVTANGGYLTKHAMGVYGTRPPQAGFRAQNVQAEVDREPRTRALVQWEGTGALEAWTVLHDREGRPERAFLSVRTPQGGRTLAVCQEADDLAEMTGRELAGVPVRVALDGTARLADAEDAAGP